MTRSPASRPNDLDDLTNLLLAGLGLLLAVAGVLWVGAWASATLTGHEPPTGGITAATGTLAHPGDPSAAWGTPMPGPLLYWASPPSCCSPSPAPSRRSSRGGGATPEAARRTRAGCPAPRHGPTSPPPPAPGSSRRRAAHTRPNLAKAAQPRPGEVGYLLGRSRGVQAWASVEDSMLLLGPPRSGKGLHVVIPVILDAPGAVVTTSTRPDNLTATMRAREAVGPVAVFDPQHLAAGVPGGLRWSPVRGCETPQTAMIRARGLAAGTGMSKGGVEGGDFWQAQTETVLRCLLHAAALDGRAARDLYRWSLDPAAAVEAVTILGRPSAAPGWEDALEQAANADPRTRDSIWLGVRQALSALADPRVLDTVTPRGGERFDPATFLTSRGTLYVLGTAAGAGAAAPLLAALVEDMVETARRLAAASAGARLDPPLLLALDEIGNLAPLPSLPALMSEGGGTGITTLTVLQSLAQARGAWGEQQAGAMWDAAIAKIILGGGSNARDLADLAALIGERDDHTTSLTRGHRGERSTSSSVRRVPVMDTSRLRTLPFGTGVLLLRTAPPIVLDLQAWTARRDATALRDGRAVVEDQLRAVATTTVHPPVPGGW